MTESNEEMDDGQKMEIAINTAISKAIAEINGGFTIKWVACIETMDPEGERGLWTFTSETATRWDVAGLIKELEHRETAHTLFHLMQDMGEQGC